MSYGLDDFTSGIQPREQGYSRPGYSKPNPNWP